MRRCAMSERKLLVTGVALLAALLAALLCNPSGAQDAGLVCGPCIPDAGIPDAGAPAPPPPPVEEAKERLRKSLKRARKVLPRK